MMPVSHYYLIKIAFGIGDLLYSAFPTAKLRIVKEREKNRASERDKGGRCAIIGTVDFRKVRRASTKLTSLTQLKQGGTIGRIVSLI